MIPKHAKIILMAIFLLLLTTAVLSACSAGQGVPDAAPTATPLPTPVTVVKDVLYASAVDPDARDQLLDIYHQPDSDEQKPVVIWAHGYSGNKLYDSSLFKSLADEGFVVFSINWHDRTAVLNSHENLREATEDGACALRFVAENAEQYSADAGNVIWAGFSAGAWIGSIISFTEGELQDVWDAYAAANNGPGQRVECAAVAEPAHVEGFVGNSGSYHGDFWLGDPVINDWTAAFLPLQMISEIGNNRGLKVRIIHGRSDPLSETPFEAAERFAAALKDAGYDVEFLPQDGEHEIFQDAVIDQIRALGE